MRFFSKKIASQSSVPEAVQCRPFELHNSAVGNFLPRNSHFNAHSKPTPALSAFQKKEAWTPSTSDSKEVPKLSRRRRLWRRLFSRKYRHQGVANVEFPSDISVTKLSQESFIPVKLVTKQSSKSPLELYAHSGSVVYKPIGGPQVPKLKDSGLAKGKSVPYGSKLLGCKLYGSPSGVKAAQLGATFDLHPFHLKEVDSCQLKWKPRVKSVMTVQEAEELALLKFGSQEMCSLGDSLPFPEYASKIPIIQRVIPNASYHTLFDVLRFAQNIEGNPFLTRVVEDVARNELLNLVAARTKKPTRDFSASLFAKFVGRESSAGSGQAFNTQTTAPTLTRDFSLLLAATSVTDHEESYSRTQRLADAIDRASQRWRSRHELYKQYRRENKEYRAMKSEAKRKIAVEKRHLRLLEKQQLLAQLQFRVLEASDINAQAKKNHHKALLQRKIDAEVAALRRRLEGLQNHVRLAEENRKVAIAIKLSLEAKEAVVGKRSRKAGGLTECDGVSPQASSTHSQFSSLMDGSQSTSKSSCYGPDRASNGQSEKKAPFMLINACINPEELEVNQWNLGVGAEIREMLAKERPVLGFKPVAKPPKAADPPKSSPSDAVAVDTKTETGANPPSATVPDKNEADSLLLVADAAKNPSDPEKSDIPKPPRRMKTPFWEQEWYITFRKNFKKGRYGCTQEELELTRERLGMPRVL